MLFSAVLLCEKQRSLTDIAEPFLLAATGHYGANISSRMLKYPAPVTVYKAAANALLYFILTLC